MQGLLLDTCAAIWVVEDAISDAGEAALDQTRDSGAGIFVSAITAWEIGLMAARGRLASPMSPLAWFEELTIRHGVSVVELSPAVLVASCFLPGRMWKDPADRMIIASAREHAMTVMTRDRAILEYAKAGFVLAAEC